ncbi:MAG: ankyrin repeat domain-containing protein [Opitutaceae bacterium]|nr:ankyrin repeat domain-containing protein [Opitutaceae bacterium]
MPTVLGLREEERRIVEEHIDDSVEPLKRILENWQEALNKKGRIPYRAMPLEPTADGLILAAARGALPFVRRLIAEGVPVDATNDVNHTALMAAAWNSQTAVVTFLLSIGANVNRRNAHGYTPLHCSVATPSAKPDLQRECARLLLDRGAEVAALDHEGGTPLMSAAWFGCLPAVQLLLERGASASTMNKRGQTAADLAQQRGHATVARVLTTGRP